MICLPLPFVQFITEHHVLTLATTYYDEPYTAALAYVLWPEQQWLLVLLPPNGVQLRHAVHNMCAAASIVSLGSEGACHSLQMQAMLYRPTSPTLATEALQAYRQHYPQATADCLWILEPTQARLGQVGQANALEWRKETLVDLDFLRKKE